MYIKRQRKTYHQHAFILLVHQSMTSLFVERASTGFPRWDPHWEISPFGWICVLQRVAVSAEDVSTAKGSWWKKLVEHQKKHVRMDSRGTKEHKSEENMTTVQTYRIKFEWLSMSQYKLWIIWLIEKWYLGWLNDIRINQIFLTTQIPFSKVFWEFVRMKRQGTQEERSSSAAYWRVLGTPWRARTDSRSSGPELVRSARVWHL